MRVQSISKDWDGYCHAVACLEGNNSEERREHFVRLSHFTDRDYRQVLASAAWLTETEIPAHTYQTFIEHLGRLGALAPGEHPDVLVISMLREWAIKGMTKAIEQLEAAST
jgi:hypothetical protein